LIELDAPEPAAYAVTVLRRVAHTGKPWTQGLEFAKDDKYIVESVGDWPTGSGSSIRLIDPATGQTVRTIRDGLGSPIFLEGITRAGDSWYVSTFRNHVVLEYDSDFNFVKSHPFAFEGWGLVQAPGGNSFIATDGSEDLLVLDNSFNLMAKKRVMCMGVSVPGLNELEMVEDFQGHGPTLLANLINTRWVLAVDPATAECVGALDLRGLEDVRSDETWGFHVANGIAFDKASGKFWFTGKSWGGMFEAKVEPSEGQPQSMLPDLRKALLSMHTPMIR